MSRQKLGLWLAGTGILLLTGIWVWLYLSWRSEQQNAQEPTDFSAVPAKVSYQAPTLALVDLQGEKRSLAELRGQVVLVNLWATWCPPCQAEMPVLQSYFQAHRGQGFLVVGVEDGEPAADVKAFVQNYGMTFPIWLDPGHQATDHAFKTPNLPSSYVVDRHGLVRLAWFGAISEENLERYVTPTIEEK